MIFTSLAFVVFFVVVWSLYQWTPNAQAQNALLLLASLVFYGWWDYRFIPLLLFVCTVAYVGGLVCEAYQQHRNKLALIISISVLLLMLALFKYYVFLFVNVQTIFAYFGIPIGDPGWSIILPIGISFYIFQGISYLADVYTGKLSARRNALDVFLYISYFPQLVAGPIVRATDFLPQIQAPRRPSSYDFLRGCRLFLIGLVYKSLFADNIAPFVDKVYEAPGQFDGWATFAAVLGFHGQIYFDFAGYSIMAIGIARTFGIHIPKNFDFPYRATSIVDFWRCWHISLSSWLRDYLYIPLGGNRAGRVNRYRNILITMLLGGLWHGANWNFVLWGSLHGAALILQREWQRLSGTAQRAGKRVFSGVLYTGAGWIVTQVFVMLCWIPFRATSFTDTTTIFGNLLGLNTVATPSPIPWAILVLPLLLDTLLGRAGRLENLRWNLRPQTVAVGLGILLAIVLLGVRVETNDFIYFQF